jgi:transcriptional regulator with XRE-family HTH domain
MIIEKTNGDDQDGNSRNPKTGAGGNGLRDSSSKPNAGRRNRNDSEIDSTKLVEAADKEVSDMKKAFGKNLARIRKKAGYSQSDLSLNIDMTHNFINELEQGIKGASFMTLVKLSAILQISPHEFFKFDENQESAEPFRYSDPIDEMVDQLHEVIDAWNGKRLK